MGRSTKKMEEERNDFNLDMDAIEKPIEMVETHNEKNVHTDDEEVRQSAYNVSSESKTYVSCLRNERIIVRYIMKKSGLVDNPKHIFYGNMAPTATRRFCVPRLSRTGAYVNVLTNDEKEFLEAYMGLEYNALSIYNKKNNYWDNIYVRLGKDDNILDLSKPDDYIAYKVLLANKNYIAPSMAELEDRPKASYQFVIVSQNETDDREEENMSVTMKCYKEFGKIEDDKDTLRVIVELMEGRPTASTVKLSYLKGRVNTLIQGDPKTFLKITTDKYLATKVLLKKALEQNIVVKRGDGYYMANDGNPLCESGDPTLNIASAYLNDPRHQSLKLSIESKLV